MRRAGFLLLLAVFALLLATTSTGPAKAHGSWQLTVGYPDIWQGPIWGGVDSYAYFQIDPNHYRLVGKLELQASEGGSWRVVDTDTNEKIQTGNMLLEVGTSCFRGGGGVRLATYYRTRLVYLRVYTQAGALHTQYTNVYRPAGFNLNYAAFCSPIF
jgi:hypothetical protein